MGFCCSGEKVTRRWVEIAGIGTHNTSTPKAGAILQRSTTVRLTLWLSYVLEDCILSKLTKHSFVLREYKQSGDRAQFQQRRGVSEDNRICCHTGSIIRVQASQTSMKNTREEIVICSSRPRRERAIQQIIGRPEYH